MPALLLYVETIVGYQEYRNDQGHQLPTFSNTIYVIMPPKFLFMVQTLLPNSNSLLGTYSWMFNRQSQCVTWISALSPSLLIHSLAHLSWWNSAIPISQLQFVCLFFLNHSIDVQPPRRLSWFHLVFFFFFFTMLSLLMLFLWWFQLKF